MRLGGSDWGTRTSTPDPVYFDIDVEARLSPNEIYTQFNFYNDRFLVPNDVQGGSGDNEIVCFFVGYYIPFI